MPTKSKTESKPMEIPPIAIKVYDVRIVSDSGLIVHRWSEKAKKEMLDKQMGIPRSKKEPKDPQRDYEEAFYRLPDGRYGFPAIGFKSAIVDAARHVEGFTMVYLRGAFHIPGELVAIEGEPVMREDAVKIGNGPSATTDLRYRPEFSEWAATLRIRLNTRALTLEQMIHLINMGGFAVGVGEWRVEKSGASGMFHVESVQEVRA